MAAAAGEGKRLSDDLRVGGSQAGVSCGERNHHEREYRFHSRVAYE